MSKSTTNLSAVLQGLTSHSLLTICWKLMPTRPSLSPVNKKIAVRAFLITLIIANILLRATEVILNYRCGSKAHLMRSLRWDSLMSPEYAVGPWHTNRISWTILTVSVKLNLSALIIFCRRTQQKATIRVIKIWTMKNSNSLIWYCKTASLRESLRIRRAMRS